MEKNINHKCLVTCFICAILLFCIACKEDIQIKDYYYEMYMYGDSIPLEYQKVKIVDSNGFRKQFTYNYFVTNGVMVFESKKYYKILGGDLFSIRKNDGNGVLYLSTKHIDSCITYGTGNEIMDAVLAETNCFQGEKSIIVNNYEFTTAYEFYKTFGMGYDNVTYRVYYDTSFIPIKYEWISGYSFVDSIRRTSCIPFESISRLKCIKYKNHTYYIRDYLKTQP